MKRPLKKRLRLAANKLPVDAKFVTRKTSGLAGLTRIKEVAQLKVSEVRAMSSEELTKQLQTA